MRAIGSLQPVSRSALPVSMLAENLFCDSCVVVGLWPLMVVCRVIVLAVLP